MHRRLPPWAALALAALGLAALYAGPLRTGFLNDDFLFLEEARARPLAESLARLGALGNYYRPLSRQVYFEALAPLAGGHPLVFHGVNFAIFLAALALLYRLLRGLAPRPGAMAGTLWFAVLPFQRVSMTWISCSQDLLALALALAAAALHRAGRTALAALPALLAFASKESALPLAAGLVAWDRWIARRPWPEALRRAAPVAAATAAWLGVMAVMRMRHPESAAFVRFGAGDFAAGVAHGLQSLLGLDHPPGVLAGLATRAPDPGALVALGGLAFAIGARAPAADAGAPAAAAAGAPLPAPRAALAFAAAWFGAFALVTGPVAYAWSSYYYTLAAVGGAAAVAVLARRAGRVAWVALCAGLLWWHAGATAPRAFAVAGTPWVWTSHLTAFYFERVAALTRDLEAQMLAREPRPAPETRFFFATLPPFAGFQMGNGALIRALYRDPTLRSHFYSQYSESTAAGGPARFLWWDGDSLRPLYDARTPDPMFQVGSDLLGLDRPRGAAYAFRQGLAAGERREDHLYWLGWAELWSGRRAEAEAAWRAWGAVDDSALWNRRLREVQTVHTYAPGDTVTQMRLLLEAVRAGIGRPEAHATLGLLLRGRRLKYAVLELKVAAWLDPRDAQVRRELVLALAEARLDDAAARELAAYRRLAPGAVDPEIEAVARRLAPAGGAGVVEF
uniref:Tetratricopeptide repeat protein n=1 Tax=Eiseniibacteriota bacterium TaxID=2212470 RepID=A0A832MKR1_UNCEI